MNSSEDLITFTILVLALTMYVRVELDFKRNVFRVAGHTIATVLLILLIAFSLGRVDLVTTLWWFLISSVYMLINEIIRVYLRKHKMSDILQNHPRLYWLSRGKIKRASGSNRQKSFD